MNLSPEQIAMAQEQMKNMSAEEMSARMANMNGLDYARAMGSGMDPSMMQNAMKMMRENPSMMKMAAEQMKNMSPEQLSRMSSFAAGGSGPAKSAPNLRRSASAPTKSSEPVPELKGRGGEASRLKKEGTALHRKKEYKRALDLYGEALFELSEMDIKSDPQAARLAILRDACYLNSAACYLELGKYKAAIRECNAVLRDAPKNAKALFRRAKARLALGTQPDLRKAKQDLLMAQTTPGLGKAGALLKEIEAKLGPDEAKDSKTARERKGETGNPSADTEQQSDAKSSGGDADDVDAKVGVAKGGVTVEDAEPDPAPAQAPAAAAAKPSLGGISAADLRSKAQTLAQMSPEQLRSQAQMMRAMSPEALRSMNPQYRQMSDVQISAAIDQLEKMADNPDMLRESARMMANASPDMIEKMKNISPEQLQMANEMFKNMTPEQKKNIMEMQQKMMAGKTAAATMTTDGPAAAAAGTSAAAAGTSAAAAGTSAAGLPPGGIDQKAAMDMMKNMDPKQLKSMMEMQRTMLKNNPEMFKNMMASNPAMAGMSTEQLEQRLDAMASMEPEQLAKMMKMAQRLSGWVAPLLKAWSLFDRILCGQGKNALVAGFAIGVWYCIDRYIIS